MKIKSEELFQTEGDQRNKTTKCEIGFGTGSFCQRPVIPYVPYRKQSAYV